VVGVPSSQSRVEAMHLLVRALQASSTLVSKARQAAAEAPSLQSRGHGMRGGCTGGQAGGAKQLWVPLPHMDVLLQLARCVTVLYPQVTSSIIIC
jgi:hypothetical protein